MHEDFLHYIWKTNKLVRQRLFTSQNEELIIQHHGFHNHLEGPDFFNAQIEVDGQLWAGNVEMHLKSSDWFAHGHETDSNYDNVILHVVWEDDVSVFRKDGTEIPSLAVKDYVSKNLLTSYYGLLKNSKKKFINCENDFASINGLVMANWTDRLYIERLEEKSTLVFDLLERFKNDWEKVLFCLLMKSFGSKVNGESFLSMAKNIQFSMVRKLSDKPIQLEALLMGIGGLLEDEDSVDPYYIGLRREYEFLKSKFRLESRQWNNLAFFGLRPYNFPTIRLSQVAQLYHKNQNLFSLLIEAENMDQLKNIFDISANTYWEDHFTFGKTSKNSKRKKLTPNFIEHILINTILPIKFCYAKQRGKDINDQLLELISGLRAENNQIVKKFDAIGTKTKNALQSQSKIQLFTKYCTKNRCLRCAIGTSLLKGNT